MVTDNATVLTGLKWTNINRKYCIETGLTIPHHQRQNYAEGIGGCFKLAVIKLFHNTPHAPLSYWCYAASFLDKTRRFLSKSSLNGRTGFQLIKGETGDISIFRFAWFEPIWFYSPSSSFPRDKMKAGYFLDVADCTGDGFSYEILPVNEKGKIPIHRNPVTLIRSVVRGRALNSTQAPSCVESKAGFKFFNRSGVELFGTEETTSPCDLGGKSQIPSLPPNIPPMSTPVNSDIDEHDIDQPLSLTNKLFLEEASNHMVLPTTLEEDSTSLNKLTNTEPVSL